MRRDRVLRLRVGRLQSEGAAAAKGKAKNHKAELKNKFVPYQIPPDDALSSDEANKLCPPGARVYRDLYNCRWLATQEDHGVRSRSWGTYGHREALVLILIWVWENYAADTGLDCPIGDIGARLAGNNGGAAATSSRSGPSINSA